jgi:hypothetical protein
MVYFSMTHSLTYHRTAYHGAFVTGLGESFHFRVSRGNVSNGVIHDHIVTFAKGATVGLPWVTSSSKKYHSVLVNGLMCSQIFR